MTTKTGFSIAAAAALIALAGCATPSATIAKEAKTVHCYGVNACKGQSDCKTAKHDCKGMNDCKGQGFKEESAATCSKQGGKVTEPA